MRKLPEQIPARGIIYDVTVTSDHKRLPRDSDGYIEPDKATIAIGAHLALQVQWEALLHEWVHAVVRHDERAYKDEMLVDDIAVSIMELLKHFGYLK